MKETELKSEYILAVEDSIIYNIDTKENEYSIKIVISEDVYDWLCRHDIEITSKGKRVFICNKVRYVDLGINFEYKNF